MNILPAIVTSKKRQILTLSIELICLGLGMLFLAQRLLFRMLQGSHEYARSKATGLEVETGYCI